MGIKRIADLDTASPLTATDKVHLQVGNHDKKTTLDDVKVFVALPSGIIMPFGGVAAPDGFLLCDGASVLRATYAALFAIIGTAYGTVDGTHFNVPDLEGRLLRGVDNAAGRDPDAGGRTAMAAGGNTGDNVGSVQLDASQGHKHTVKQVVDGVGAVTGAQYQTGSRYTPGYYANVSNPIDDGANGTPRTASETRPINAYVNYIIKT